jgi:hypothetical protein
MAVTQYNPEKLFEKMENNFVQALEKVCKQQADMFASKMEVSLFNLCFSHLEFSSSSFDCIVAFSNSVLYRRSCIDVF